MFCGNCGAENPNEAKFCKSCGKALDKLEDSQEGENVGSSRSASRTEEKIISSTTSKVDENQFVGKLKKIPKKFLLGIGTTVIVLISIIYMLSNTEETINLNDYLIIETEGYDGYGEMSASVDWDAIKEEYGDKLSYTREAKNEFDDFVGLFEPIDLLSEYVYVSLSDIMGLSNGEEVKGKWSVNEEATNFIRCKLIYSDELYVVSGLMPVEKFDVFSDLDVNFFNPAPYGSIAIDYNGIYFRENDFDIDKAEGLNNGDIVKITVKKDALRKCVEHYGQIPEPIDKEYTVSGLGKFPLNAAEIKADEEAFTNLQQQALQVYREKLFKDERETFENLIYLGNYYLTLKNTDPSAVNNMLIMVYKAQVRNNFSNGTESFDEVNEYYWYISFNDLMFLSDEKVDLEFIEYELPSGRVEVDSEISESWLYTKVWTYYGYKTLDDLYKAAVTPNLEDYICEDNLDESLVQTSKMNP